jgi:hypothetical protein
MMLVAARNPQSIFTITGIDKAEVSSNDSAKELLAGLSGGNHVKQPRRRYVLQKMPMTAHVAAKAQLQPRQGPFAGK